MIQLSSHLGDEFRVDATQYESNPTSNEVRQIRWIESQIIQETREFLADPEYFFNQWQDLTEEAIPAKYLEKVPQEIVSIIGRGKGLRPSGDVRIKFLPVIDRDGNNLIYPEDRLVVDYLRFNQKVYVLKDSLLKKLQTV